MAKIINNLFIRVNSTSRVIVLSVLFGLLTFGATLSFDFVWDDFPTVVHNPSLHDPQTLWKAFTQDFWGLHEIPEKSGYWRPLPTILYTLMTLIVGVKPWGFHALNLLLHLGVSVLGTLLLSQIGITGIPLLASSLFYAFHPIHSETVSFVSALPDLLAAFFGLSAVLVLHTNKLRSHWKISLGTFFLGLALLSKESAMAFIGIIFVFVLWGTEKQRFSIGLRKKLFMMILGMTILYIMGHLLVVRETSIRPLWGGSISEHAATLLRVAPISLGLTLFPFPTSPTRVLPISSGFKDPLMWGALATLMTISVCCWSLRKRYPLLVRALMMYGVFWLPVSNLIPLEGLVADRYSYLPTLGTASLVGFVVGELVRLFQVRTVLSIIFSLSLGWSILALRASLFWKNDETLWRHATIVSPTSNVAWNQWGVALLHREKYKEAIVAFERALALSFIKGGDYREASYNRVLVLYRTSEPSLAKIEIENHLNKFSKDAQGWDLLGTVYARLEDWNNAILAGQKVLSLAPTNWKYHFNLGLSFVQKGDFVSAIRPLEQAHQLSPNNIEVLVRLAQANFYSAHWQEAISYYKKILLIAPDHAESLQAVSKIGELLMLKGGLE